MSPQGEILWSPKQASGGSTTGTDPVPRIGFTRAATLSRVDGGNSPGADRSQRLACVGFCQLPHQCRHIRGDPLLGELAIDDAIDLQASEDDVVAGCWDAQEVTPVTAAEGNAHSHPVLSGEDVVDLSLDARERVLHHLRVALPCFPSAHLRGHPGEVDGEVLSQESRASVEICGVERREGATDEVYVCLRLGWHDAPDSREYRTLCSNIRCCVYSTAGVRSASRNCRTASGGPRACLRRDRLDDGPDALALGTAPARTVDPAGASGNPEGEPAERDRAGRRAGVTRILGTPSAPNRSARAAGDADRSGQTDNGSYGGRPRTGRRPVGLRPQRLPAPPAPPCTRHRGWPLAHARRGRRVRAAGEGMTATSCAYLSFPTSVLGPRRPGGPPPQIPKPADARGSRTRTSPVARIAQRSGLQDVAAAR